MAEEQTVAPAPADDSGGEAVEQALRKRKPGGLKSRSGKRIKSKQQAVAIGLSKAREKGASVPPPPGRPRRRR